VRRDRVQDGQAAAEFVAVAPILLCVVLALAQLAVAGFALWSAGDAARAGARAAHVGADAERAALSELPSWLEAGAEVDGAGPVEVTVQAPAVLPGVPDIAVHAAAGLGVEAAGG
jgi:TadE-like protein